MADERRYFTAIPNMVFDMGLSIQAVALYAHLARVTGPDGGECRLSVRRLAKAVNMSPGAVVNAKQELASNKLVKITKQTSRLNRAQEEDVIEVVKDWAANNARYNQGTEGSTTSEPRSPIEHPPVHMVNTPRFTSGYPRSCGDTLIEEQNIKREDRAPKPEPEPKPPAHIDPAVLSAWEAIDRLWLEAFPRRQKIRRPTLNAPLQDALAVYGHEAIVTGWSWVLTSQHADAVWLRGKAGPLETLLNPNTGRKYVQLAEDEQAEREAENARLQTSIVTVDEPENEITLDEADAIVRQTKGKTHHARRQTTDERSRDGGDPAGDNPDSSARLVAI